MILLGSSGGSSSGVAGYFNGDKFTAGDETYIRKNRGDSATLTSGSMVLTFFTSSRAENVTSIRMICGGVAAVTPTLIRFGLYSIAANGDGTLVAATDGADTTALAAANTTYTRNLTATYGKLAGQRYAIAALSVAATAGSLIGIVPSAFLAEMALAPRQSGRLNGQTDLPASFTDAALATSNTMYYGVVL